MASQTMTLSQALALPEPQKHKQEGLLLLIDAYLNNPAVADQALAVARRSGLHALTAAANRYFANESEKVAAELKKAFGINYDVAFTQGKGKKALAADGSEITKARLNELTNASVRAVRDDLPRLHSALSRMLTAAGKRTGESRVYGSYVVQSVVDFLNEINFGQAYSKTESTVNGKKVVNYSPLRGDVKSFLGTLLNQRVASNGLLMALFAIYIKHVAGLASTEKGMGQLFKVDERMTRYFGPQIDAVIQNTMNKAQDELVKFEQGMGRQLDLARAEDLAMLPPSLRLALFVRQAEGNEPAMMRYADLSSLFARLMEKREGMTEDQKETLNSFAPQIQAMQKVVSDTNDYRVSQMKAQSQ